VKSSKIALVVVLACASTAFAQQKPTTKASRTVPVSGSTFVVTKGGNAIKLGLVTVSVYEEKGLNPQIESALEFSSIASAALKDKKEALEIAFKEKKDLLSKSESDLKAAILKRDASNPNEYHNNAWAVDKAFERKSAAYDEYRAAEDAYKAVLQTMLAIVSARTYTQKFSGAIDAQKTDADGVFTFDLRPGEYVASAVASRRVGDLKEDYTWLVKFKVEKKPVRLLLSNDNMIETECEECVKFMK